MTLNQQYGFSLFCGKVAGLRTAGTKGHITAREPSTAYPLDLWDTVRLACRCAATISRVSRNLAMISSSLNLARGCVARTSSIKERISSANPSPLSCRSAAAISRVSCKFTKISSSPVLAKGCVALTSSIDERISSANPFFLPFCPMTRTCAFSLGGRP